MLIGIFHIAKILQITLLGDVCEIHLINSDDLCHAQYFTIYNHLQVLESLTTQKDHNYYNCFTGC